MFPEIGQGSFIEESFQAIGDVAIGYHSSVGFNTVIRGDGFFIPTGENTNMQDLCLLHVSRD